MSVVINFLKPFFSSIDADLLGRQKQLEQKQLEYDEIAKKFLAPGERQKERYEHYHKSFSRDPEWRQLMTLAQKEDPLDEKIKKLEKMLKDEEKKIASFENHGEGLQNEWVCCFFMACFIRMFDIVEKRAPFHPLIFRSF